MQNSVRAPRSSALFATNRQVIQSQLKYYHFMIKPADYKDEEARLEELASFSIMDSLPEEDYDYLTGIAAQICDTPVALVTLLDGKRQWFKSIQGLDLEVAETPKEYSFCAHAIHQPQEIFVVEDSRKDERFYDNPLVTGAPNAVFYAGMPLVSDNNLPLGTLCVADNKPKQGLSEGQQKALKSLARQVMNLMNLRKKQNQLETALDDLNQINTHLSRFVTTVLDDTQSPLIAINRVTKFLILDKDIQRHSFKSKMVDSLHKSSEELKVMLKEFKNQNNSMDKRVKGENKKG